MDEDERKAARLAEVEELCVRTLGLAMPDRLSDWLGVARRSAERWLSGALSFPDPVVERLYQQAPLSEALMEDLKRLAQSYRDQGMHENLLKMRMKDFARDALSDEPPPKDPPRRRSEDIDNPS